MYMCLWRLGEGVCVCECMCPQRLEEGLESSGARVKGSCALSNLVLGTKLRSFGRMVCPLEG